MKRPTLNMRFEPDVLDAFKATSGPGWDESVDAALVPAIGKRFASRTEPNVQLQASSGADLRITAAHPAQATDRQTAEIRSEALCVFIMAAESIPTLGKNPPSIKSSPLPGSAKRLFTASV